MGIKEKILLINNKKKMKVINYSKMLRKKVRFNDNVSTRIICVYPFASRQARIGPWEQIARDRQRFKLRCQKTAVILNPIIFKKRIKYMEYLLNPVLSKKYRMIINV